MPQIIPIKELKNTTEGYCDIWPGIELDIIGKVDQKGNYKRGHLIVIANPKNVELFNVQVQELIKDEDVNTFQIGVKKVYDMLGICDCIYACDRYHTALPSYGMFTSVYSESEHLSELR